MTDSYHRRLAKITSASIHLNVSGRIDITIDLDYGTRAGVFALCSRNEWDVDHMIKRLLRACGAKAWADVIGHTVYALFASDSGPHDSPVGIENLPTEQGERFMFVDANKPGVFAWTSSGVGGGGGGGGGVR